MASAIRSKISNILNSTVAASSRLAGSSGTPLSATGPDSIVTITSTMNNVHCVVSDIEGQVVSKCSGGMVGLKHRARAAPLAGIEISRKAVEKAVARGFSLAHVRLKGPSRGRGQLLQGIAAAGMRVADIRDVTPYPTNGCRPPSARRL